MKRFLFAILFVAGLFASAAFGQDTVRVSGSTGTVTWESSKVYVLEGYVTVDSTEVLTIEAGTVVLADTGSLENASALIVNRGAMIMAEGTATDPIIFSSIQDDVNDPDDFLDNQTVGLWGGIIVCGEASTNTSGNGTEQVEGIPSTLPANVGVFGGNVDNDNSGVIKYVSIRHTGVALASNNEIQGLTLAGVGSGTTIDYVESYASDDDGIEIFGGTVNLKHVAIVFAADDMLDLDQGYRGKGQYIFIMQSQDYGDRMGEWDGADNPEDGTPLSDWEFWNMTMMGRKPGASDRVITYRANGGGQVWNSVIINQERGVDVQIKSDSVVSSDSYDLFVDGTTALANNIFWNVADNTASGIFKISPVNDDDGVRLGVWPDSAAQVDAAIAAFEASFAANGNVASDPMIAAESYTSNNGLDPRFYAPEVTTNLGTPSDPWFECPTYKGAFSPGPEGLWVKGWTALDHYGYLVEDPTPDTVRVSGTTGSATWTNDKVYVLEGYVVVDSLDELKIQAGTVVLADTGSLENASALIVNRGGKIYSLGTADAPVIFSSIQDDVNDPNDFLDNQIVGLWGGIIVCGEASTNTSGNGTEQVEGIPSTLPANVGVFGGNVDNDNSGIIRYTSIRHTGVALASNNEIQGLTLAGVGSGTTIEYVESYASDDDGIEIFGGTVNLRNIAIVFAADDMLDLDQGYRGKAQNIFIWQSQDYGDRMGEWDGADNPEDGTPTSAWVFSNFTMIGRKPGADDRVITYRANGRGQLWNSVIINQSSGVDVQIKSDSVVSQDSYDGIADGQLALANNVFWNVADNTAAGIFKISPVNDDDGVRLGVWPDSATEVDAAIAAFTDMFDNLGNVAVDPKIESDWLTTNKLDPRFQAFEITENVGALNATDDFFVDYGYKGAFGRGEKDLWIKGWTAVDHYGYLVDMPGVVTSNEEIFEGPAANIQLFPNPTTGIVNIVASDLHQSSVKISVYDIQGRVIANEFTMPVAGELNTQLDLSAQQAGMYFVAVENNGKVSVSRVVIK